MKKIQQVRIITRAKFYASNRELSEDAPGNEMQLDDYINMIAVELSGLGKITKIEIIAAYHPEYLAFIFYHYIK